jgi:protein deglycase
MTVKQVLVPIADGSEEIETTCITDTLTRFGAKVTVASVKDKDLVCTMSRGIKFMADCTVAEAATKTWDLVALPGGMPGAEHLRDCKPLIEILQKQKSAGKQYAAICAAPAVVLASQGLIQQGAVATCYPAPKFRDAIAKVSENAVVVSDNMTTSKGPGTALAFALQLGENLYGKEKRDQIAKEMLTV